VTAHRATAGLALLVALTAGTIACSGAGGGHRQVVLSPSSESNPITTEPAGGCANPVDGAPPTAAPGDQASATTTVPATTATTTPEGGGDPFAALGARQHAGPSTTTTLVPETPVSAVVAPPPNPDIGTAAETADPSSAPVEGQAAARPVVIERPGQADPSTTTTTYPTEVGTAQVCAGDKGTFP
jgi:hypothetical protein